MNKPTGGFTLIELMIVITVIGILSTIALPTYQDRIIRAQIKSGLELAAGIKQRVTDFYVEKRRFPASNSEAGVPVSEHLIGNHVKRIEVVAGAIHVLLGNRVNDHIDGKVLSLRPATVTGSPASPISWLCGYAEPVAGMQAAGENRTNVPDEVLPMTCRVW